MSVLSDINIETLQGLTLKDLVDFKKKLLVAIEKREEIETKDFIDIVDQLAIDSGLSMNDIFATKAKAKAKSKSIPKYRNPSNKNEEWTGKGRKPKWVLGLLEEGKSLEELKISTSL